MTDIEIRSDCEHAELNRANGIVCIPTDLCNLCKREEMTPEERNEIAHDA